MRGDRDELGAELVELRELLGHRLVALREAPELVAPLGREGQPMGEVAACHLGHPLLEIPHGFADRSPEQHGDGEREPHRKEHRRDGRLLRARRLVGGGPDAVARPDAERQLGLAAHRLHLAQRGAHVSVGDGVQHVERARRGGRELRLRVTLDGAERRRHRLADGAEAERVERIDARSDAVHLRQHGAS